VFDVDFFMRAYDLKQEIIRAAGTSRRPDPLRVRDQIEAMLGARPFVFNIETTNHCNMRCVMCQRSTDLSRPLRHMDQELFVRLAEQIEPHPAETWSAWQAFVDSRLRVSAAPSENNFYYDIVARSVTLHGFGEPLLDRRLPERVRLLTERAIPSYFSCNPCNIKLDAFERLFDAGLGCVKFALDSLDDAEAKQIRGQRADFSGSYQKILEVLALRKRMRSDTLVVLTMLDFWGEEGPDSQPRRFLELWKDKDVYAYVKSVDNKWLLRKKGAVERALGKDGSHYSRQYCEYPFTSLTVLADGEVVPCTQDINGRWVLGDAREQSLAEIWSSERAKELRRRHILGNFEEEFMCHSRCDQTLAAYCLGTRDAH
jgi:radical SAM protein with 4Fe4S-binding SPASM domain